MAVNNIISTIPEDVLTAAKIALNKDVTTANDIGDGVMFGGRNSYEDDDWVKIVFDGEGNISSVTKPHPFSDASIEDITNMVLEKMEEDNATSTEDTENEEQIEEVAHVTKKRLIKQ